MSTVTRASRLIPALAIGILVAGTVGGVQAADRSAVAQGAPDRAWEERSDDVRLVVTLEPGTARSKALGLERAATRLVEFDAARHRAIYELSPSAVRAESARLEASASVESVQVSRRLFRDLDPADEDLWPILWGLDNRGQDILGVDGTTNVDIDGKQSLAAHTGAGVVVAVIDDGVDFTRSDLSGQAWVNPGESGDGRETNGVDDDANGYIDDVNGWDFCHDDKTVHDVNDDFHGTHVAGTIASKLNGTGIVGVAPAVRIMALKFLGDDAECGWDDQAIEAIEYAASFDVRISNNSWGRQESDFPSEDQPLKDAIAASGMLFIASAGNAGLDNDDPPFLVGSSIPASFNLPNILSVAAIDNQGFLASFSNYGATSVDVSAPGVSIVSSLPAYNGFYGTWSAGYYYLDGTSMAAPHVTGIAALVAEQTPAMLDTPTAIKARILDSAKPAPNTKGLTLTGDVASAANALDSTAPTVDAPNSYAFLTGKAIGSSIQTRVRWSPGSDDLSGVASYAVRHSVNAAAWTTLTAATTATSLDRSLAFGKTYRYRVRAHDRAGNTGAYVDGPLVKPKLVQQSPSTAVTYGGTWSTTSSSAASGGTTRYATKAGAWVQYTFTGRALAVVAPKGSSRGSVKAYVDGVYVGTISAYRSSSQSKIVLFARNWGSSGSHKVKLVLTGTAGHPRFDIDAFATLQ